MAEVEPAVDSSFDRYARMVRRTLGVPVALVSIVEETRQVFPGAQGLPEPYQLARETPLSHSFCQYVVKDERPLVVTDARLDPQLADNLAIVDLQVVAYAGWPLTDHTGRTIGSLCAIDTRPRVWTDADLETLEDLAALCSAELAQRELFRSAGAAVQQAQRSAGYGLTRLALAERLSTPSTFVELATAIEDAAIELLGCLRAGMWLGSDLVPDQAATSAAELRFVPTARDDWPRATEFSLLGADDSTPIGEAFRTGTVLAYRDQAAQLVDFPRLPLEAADGEGRAFVPVEIGAYVFGTLALVWPTRRYFTDEERVTVAAFASYVAHAVQRSLVLQERADTADTLQRAMLTTLPELGGLELAARYRPAATREQVGGDWYDALVLPSGLTAVVIGDVVGHDIQAAAAMGQIRSILRSIAWSTGKTPSSTVEALDGSLQALGVEAMATLVYGWIEQGPDQRAAGARTFRWTSAGHPPPLLLEPGGGGRWLTLDQQGSLIGTGSARGYAEGAVEVEPGSRLVLYTDGLVERRGEHLDTGLARLQAAAVARRDLPVREFVDALLDELVNDHLDDDVAVLTIVFGEQ